jgi:beta-1,4-mannosyl-glycoprotein beta-1,4-N-acetylglucosaminyltransferase
MFQIVDAFLFYNEIEMLDYRLSVLDEVVDFFVIVEMTHTFAGNPKPMYFTENRERYKQFENKIIYVRKEASYKSPNIDFHKCQQWINEYEQRESMKEGINTISNKLNPGDIITISDVDEIPNPELLKNIKKGKRIIQKNLFYALIQEYYCYNLTCKNSTNWDNSKLFTYQFYIENVKNAPSNLFMLSRIRFCYRCYVIENGGWHLSFFGTPDFIQNKLKQFSHQEFNDKERTNNNYIISSITNYTNIINKKVMIDIPIEENANLPPRYEEHACLFYKYIYL